VYATYQYLVKLTVPYPRNVLMHTFWSVPYLWFKIQAHCTAEADPGGFGSSPA